MKLDGLTIEHKLINNNSNKHFFKYIFIISPSYPYYFGYNEVDKKVK